MTDEQGALQMTATHSSDALSRRSAIRLVVGGTAALLTACGAPAPSAVPAAPTQPASKPAAPAGGPTAAVSVPQAATKPAPQPKAGGTLRVGVLGDLQGLDGHVTTGLDSSRRIWDIVTALDEKLNPLPVLAESLDLSQDARQMKLNLRKGVQFHTQRELTSEDLAWNFNRLKDPKVNPTYANLVKPFATMETPDKYTLIVQFDAPNPFVVDALPALPMLDPVTFQQSGAQTPVGTGPFSFVNWDQGEKIRLKKNPNYWDTGKPYLDAVEFTIFSDPQALISFFEAGALDVAIQPTLNDWVRIQKEQRAQALINQNSGNYLALAFNVTQPPRITNSCARR